MVQFAVYDALKYRLAAVPAVEVLRKSGSENTGNLNAPLVGE